MKFEDVGTESIVDRLIDLATDRSHGKGVVLSMNMITKEVANVILSSKQLEKLGRDRVERWQDHFSTETAHTKLGMSISGFSELFGHPMECMTVGTLNIHSSQIMDRPVRIEGLPCNWQWNSQWWYWWQIMTNRRINDIIKLD